MNGTRTILAWGGLALAILVPFALAAASPLLAWRDPIYIAAGFAGVAGLGLLLTQPALAAGLFPGLSTLRARRIHRWGGVALILAILVHVGGLWITSPPDMVDALLFASPTRFSAWGVIAMWTLFGAAFLAVFRRRLRLRWRIWRLAHSALAAATVVGSVVHASLIEGTMEPISKAGLCALVVLATAWAVVDLRDWALRSRQDP